jgi:hypothetical protein
MAVGGILISALVAGVAAVLVTLAIEKWGGLHGGVLATVPSTIVPAAVGIWYASATVEEFQSAMGIVPIGLILNAGFLYLWRIVPERIPEWRFGVRISTITAVTLTLWFVAAALSIFLVREAGACGFSALGIGWLALVIGCILAAVACLKRVPTPAGHKRVGALTLFIRGLAAAASIGVAVWLAGLGNPLASGVMSIFPAIFTTSMVALWLAQGEAVPTGAIGPMMLGSQSVSLYALLVALFYPRAETTFELVIMSFAAWIIAFLIINMSAWYWLKRRASA